MTQRSAKRKLTNRTIHFFFSPLHNTNLVVVGSSQLLKVQKGSLDLEHAIIHAFRDIVLTSCVSPQITIRIKEK